MTTTATIDQRLMVRRIVIDADNSLWNLYEQAMKPLAHRAAQRHMLTPAEFEDILLDSRIEKHLAYAGGQLVGLAVCTSKLDAWPLISPDYFRHHYPNRTVWYIGFVITAPRSLGVLGPLIDSLSYKARYSGGVAVADFCTFNLDRLKISERIDTLLKRLDPTAMLTTRDAQEFHAWTFANPHPPA